jgi:hypothetical protein
MSAKSLTGKNKALTDTLSFIPKLRQYPLGAMLGIVTAASMNYLAPELTPDGWMQAPFTLSCVAGGMLLERTLHYMIGWYLDPQVHHAAVSREARIRLAKLREYQRAGVITEEDARRIAAQIAKRDVAGSLKPAPRVPRGPYKKKKKGIVPKPEAPEPETPDPSAGADEGPQQAP